MTCFEAYINDSITEFFKRSSDSLVNFHETNRLIKKTCGINNFFTSQKEATELLTEIKKNDSIVTEPDRREYGDFQTNKDLALHVVQYAFSKHQDFEFLLEPTCGKGNFIIASLEQSALIKKVVGVEIYLPYVWETKFKILSYFLEHNVNFRPDIEIIHGNAFDFSFQDLSYSTRNLKTLIIGNPPWVTNSELGTIDSKNLPNKTNFKNHSGFDAITGKGNFDIGEYITLSMLNCFDNHNGIFTFLIKNSVVKNIIYDQKKNLYRISQSEKLNINAKKEFNASVNACLFLTRLNSQSDLTCKVYDFYTKKYLTTFGWFNNKFVNSINDYNISSIVDGKSIFTWRSGVKHDCSKVMELINNNEYYVNALGEKISLEKKLIYGILKSSDLKVDKTKTFRKLTIITQNNIGQDTSYIKSKYPLTYKYLTTHKEFFKKRKSSIYKDKPEFSIFGIGDYSFAKYKVAISGLYKSTHFTLIFPHKSKPIMLDDTCYFIGFDNLRMAQIAYFLLNSEIVQRFLKSIIFSDSKRSINKDVLMRIDFEKAFNNSHFEDAKEKIIDLKIEDWEKFGDLVKKQVNQQMTLF